MCYNYGKQGIISKYCMLKKKLRNLNLELVIEEQINNLLIETSEEETETSSSMLSDENLNIILICFNYKIYLCTSVINILGKTKSC